MYWAFVWARRALKHQKRRLPARAGSNLAAVFLQGPAGDRGGEALAACEHALLLDAGNVKAAVRRAWPRAGLPLRTNLRCTYSKIHTTIAAIAPVRMIIST